MALTRRIDDPALFVDPTLETMGRDDLAAYQWQRLAPMLSRIQERNPFYRSKWAAAGVGAPREHGAWDAFRRLPFTTKAELVTDQEAAPPFGTDLTYPLDRYLRLHQTSGTTGRPLRWLDTAESWDWWLRCWTFVYRAAGVGAGDRIYFAFSFGPFIGFWAGFDAVRRIGALAIPGGGLDTPLRIRALMEAQATVLVCTPSYALRLAEVARGDLLPVFDVQPSRVLDLVDALLDVLHGDRDPGAVHADLARDRGGHVGLALRAALRLREGLAGHDVRAVLHREDVPRGDADRHRVVL